MPRSASSPPSGTPRRARRVVARSRARPRRARGRDAGELPGRDARRRHRRRVGRTAWGPGLDERRRRPFADPRRRISRGSNSAGGMIWARLACPRA